MKIFDKKSLLCLLDKAKKINEKIVNSSEFMAYYDEVRVLQGQIDLLQQMVKIIDNEQEEIIFDN